MIHYSLHVNNLTNGADNYRAIVHSNGILGLEQITDKMIERGSTLTKADALAGIHEFFGALETALVDGFRVSTPLGIIFLSIRGNFEDEFDSFLKNRNSIEPNLKFSTDFKQNVQRRARVEQVEATVPEPSPTRVINPVSGAEDYVLTPGGGVKLRGRRLMVDQDDPNQGVFLVPLNGTAQAGDPRRVDVLLKNSSRELAFLVPADLAPGEYEIEVKSLFGLNIRTGALPETLTVA